MEQAYSKTGGLAFLFGNIAKNGCVVKRSAVAPEMRVHSCRAKVFNGEEAAVKAIYGGEIQAGDIVVIIYEGPKGGPGMREMLVPTSALAGMQLDKDVALITDGRFSGASGAPLSAMCPPRLPPAARSGCCGMATSSISTWTTIPSTPVSATRSSLSAARRRSCRSPG